MSEVKPVAWRMNYIGRNVHAKEFITPHEEEMQSKADGIHYTATPLVELPTTHRIVSVELLRKIEKFADEAQSHYSGMNDEVCQSYSEPWQQALIIMGLVGAIIDKVQS